MTVTGEIQWDEGPLSVAPGSANAVLPYILSSDDPANDERDDALNWMLNNSPDTLFGLSRDETIVEELIRDENNPAEQDKKWFGRVSYKNKERQKPESLKEEDPPNNEVRLSIRSGSGGNLTQLYSRELIEEQAVDPVYQFGNDILIDRALGFEVDNDEDNGSQFVIKGIQKRVGTVELVAETLIPKSYINAGYLVTAAQYADEERVNDKVWRGFPAHSVKILNVDGVQRSGNSADTDANTEAWRITYTFSFSAEVSAYELNLNPPPGMGTLNFTKPKRGWDILDILYVDSQYNPSPGITMLIPAAKRMAIHQIQDELDFQATLFV